MMGLKAALVTCIAPRQGEIGGKRTSRRASRDPGDARIVSRGVLGRFDGQIDGIARFSTKNNARNNNCTRKSYAA